MSAHSRIFNRIEWAWMHHSVPFTELTLSEERTKIYMEKVTMRVLSLNLWTHTAFQVQIMLTTNIVYSVHALQTFFSLLRTSIYPSIVFEFTSQNWRSNHRFVYLYLYSSSTFLFFSLAVLRNISAFFFLPSFLYISYVCVYWSVFQCLVMRVRDRGTPAVRCCGRHPRVSHGFRKEWESECKRRDMS